MPICELFISYSLEELFKTTDSGSYSRNFDSADVVWVMRICIFSISQVTSVRSENNWLSLTANLSLTDRTLLKSINILTT
jgi:hypothetical protein